MSFRIGRKTAQHAYPQARATTTVPLARNSASGPDPDQTIFDTEAGVVWSVIESSGGSGTDVPIIPKATGIVHVTGVITVSSATNAVVHLRVLRGDPPPSFAFVPSAEMVAIAAGATVAIPFDTIIGAGANFPILPIGAMSFILISLSVANENIVVIEASSTISIQEVMPVTG